MSEELVLTKVDPGTGLARIALNRPSVLNALSVPLSRAFLKAVREVTERSDVRAILLSGEGRAFLAGGDLAAFGAEPERGDAVVNELLDLIHPAILALRAFDAPVIAAVQGVAAGAGLSIVLAADLVVAAEDARFLIAYDKVGTSPDCGATWFLPRKVGTARAAELMLLGESLSAPDALTAGIVNRVVPAAELAAQSEALALKVAAGPTRAFGAYRRLVDAALERPLAAQLEAEREAFASGTRTEDFREGVAAFLAKRPAAFKGR